MWTDQLKGSPEIVYVSPRESVLNPTLACERGMRVHQLHPLFGVPEHLRNIFYRFGGMCFPEIGFDPLGTSTIVLPSSAVPIARGVYNAVFAKKTIHIHRPISELPNAPLLEIPPPDRLLLEIGRPRVWVRRQPENDQRHRELLAYTVFGTGSAYWRFTIAGNGIFRVGRVNATEATINLATRRLLGYAYQQGWNLDVAASQVL